MDRFYFDGTTINGYFGISDRNQEDMVIWIDCPKEYIEIIIKALNKMADNS